MMTSFDSHAAAPSVSGASILGAALASAFAPGLFLGVGLAFAGADRAHFLEVLVAASMILSLVGVVVGAPFAALIFAPAILILRQYWRLNWLATTVAGYFSVFIVGFGHCVIEGSVASGVRADALFALCGAVAGFCFWLVVGDLEKVES